MTGVPGRIRYREYVPPAVALLLIAAGALASVSGSPGSARLLWYAGLAGVGAPVVWRTLRQAMRGHFATDLVASMAIIAAVALREPLAGLVVVLMQTGGEALEKYASGRASLALRHLEAAAPSIAHLRENGGTRDVAVDAIEVGNELLVRPGEMLPCDCVVVSGESVVDAAHLTGEPFPVAARPGVALLSGSIVGDSAIVVRATAVAAQSQYARIVHLVRTAQESKAPLQRMADKYAIWFTPATLVVCAAAYAVSGDPVRVLAVLVVATPCPLILAAPVAIIAGINRAARAGIIVRTGTALEQIGQVTTVLFDKTGTLTIGKPEVESVEIAGTFPADDVLRLAAAIEESSSHLLARTLVAHVAARGLTIPQATSSREYPGRGVVGVVDGRTVAVGSHALVTEHAPAAAASISDAGRNTPRLTAYVAIDGQLSALIHYADRTRDGVKPMLDRMAALGVRRHVLLSGDSTLNVSALASAVGIAEAHGDMLPADKVRFAEEAAAGGNKVLMVGDGTNDAPALATATVGLALGGHSGGITTESADIVLLVDDVARVASAVEIGQRTIRVARQSIWAGLILSGTAMLFAAAGEITPTVGALLQEVIDIAVILNALRASRG